jgi:hypothetical protein
VYEICVPHAVTQDTLSRAFGAVTSFSALARVLPTHSVARARGPSDVTIEFHIP